MPCHSLSFTQNIYAPRECQSVTTETAAKIGILFRWIGIPHPLCTIGLTDLILNVKILSTSLNIIIIGQEPYMIGLLGSMVFAGWMFGSLFIPRLGDLYGRKWPFLGSLLVAVIAYVSVILSSEIKLTIGLMFLFGACCAGRYSTCYVYLSEMMPAPNRTLACSATLFIDASTLILLTFYFRFVSKHWLPF